MEEDTLRNIVGEIITLGKNGEMNGILVCGINRGESERGTEIS